jgi:hypothetical protein
MNKEEIKAKIISDLPKEVQEKLPKFYHALIDEAIEAVLDGEVIINEKKPETFEEYITFTMYSIMVRLKSVEVLKGSLSKAFPNENVTINYRGTTMYISPLSPQSKG